MTEIQKRLLYITDRLIQSDFKPQNLRGVTAFWRNEDHTACISFILMAQFLMKILTTPLIYVEGLLLIFQMDF